MTKAGLSKMTKAGHSWLLNMKEKNYQVVKSPSELYPEKKIIKNMISCHWNTFCTISYLRLST